MLKKLWKRDRIRLFIFPTPFWTCGGFFILIMLWASKPPRPLSRSPALSHVRTPSQQSTRCGSAVHTISTPRADFRAELLLTQPPVNLAFGFSLSKRKNNFSNRLFYFLVFSHSLLPGFSSPPASALFPKFDHIPVPTASLPRSHGFSTDSPTVPRSPQLTRSTVPEFLVRTPPVPWRKSHGLSCVSTQNTLRSQSTARQIRRSPETPVHRRPKEFWVPRLAIFCLRNY